MGIKIKVTLPDSLKGKGKIEKVIEKKGEILEHGGKELAKLLRNWMRDLDSSRSKHGSHHFTPSGIHAPIVEGDSVSVPIYIAGITRALHDIVINPVEAKSLALPVNDSAYGIAPREYNDRHPKGTPEALFKPKGKDYLAKNDNAGNLVVMYILRKSVHQKQDSTLLPPDDQMNQTVMDAVSDAVEVILNS